MALLVGSGSAQRGSANCGVGSRIICIASPGEEDLVVMTEMSLPIDIPWKRMGVSQDMIDPKMGDLLFPEKWRSSLAVFYHEPPDLPPDYCDRRITYLKIVATIANYQIDGEDVSVLEDLREKQGEFYAWKEFESNITQSFPCYGALLQVSVFPNPPEQRGEPVPLHDYPYISGFQPRKREMYEVLTESGEVASQSGSKLNVLKGTTNTETTEDYDLNLGGGGGGGHGGLFGLWSYQEEQKPQEQKGTIARSQDQNQNVVTTDGSRDHRESHSYSTNVNQLYTLLQGYHLGTNRSMFFMQPRPHMQDQKFSFVRGLRRLEGIQEFFLIIDRPASVPGICVEIALETAHAYLERAYMPRLIPLEQLYDPGNLAKTAAALGIVVNAVENPKAYFKQQLVDAWYLATPLDKLWAGAWPELPAQLANHAVPNDIGKLLMVVEQVPGIGIQDIAMIFEEYESDSGTFFVTGRRLCSCLSPQEKEGELEEAQCEYSSEEHVSTCDSPGRDVVYWKRNPELNIREPDVQGLKSADMNGLIQELNQVLWSSLASPERHPYGEISFLETDFVLDDLAQVVRLLQPSGIQDRPVDEIDELRGLVERGLGSNSGVRTVLDLGRLSTASLARDLGVRVSEARRIRRNLLVTGLRSLDAGTARPDALRVNPIQERFQTRFPPRVMREIIDSARPVEHRGTDEVGGGQSKPSN